MTSQLDALDAIARVLLILGGGATLMAMGIIALTNPDASFPLKPGVLLFLLLVLLLNKEKALTKLIHAWRGDRE